MTIKYDYNKLKDKIVFFNLINSFNIEKSKFSSLTNTKNLLNSFNVNYKNNLLISEIQIELLKSILYFKYKYQIPYYTSRYFSSPLYWLDITTNNVYKKYTENPTSEDYK